MEIIQIPFLLALFALRIQLINPRILAVNRPPSPGTRTY